MNIMERVRGLLGRAPADARPYRFEGEQEAHADQLRETEVSLSLMATADAADPDQGRMASDIEHGAENRLTVLLGKARLTVEEKRERDAIQTALRQRRQGFEEPAPVLVRRESGWTPQRFLGPLAANPVVALLFNPITWIVALVAFCGLQMALKERVENQRDEARADVARLEQSREEYAAALAQERGRHASELAGVLEDTADTVETLQRQAARRAAREARERSRREELNTGSVDFTERLRELAQPEGERLPALSAPAPSGDPAGAMPTEPGPDADNGANP